MKIVLSPAPSRQRWMAPDKLGVLTEGRTPTFMSVKPSDAHLDAWDPSSRLLEAIAKPFKQAVPTNFEGEIFAIMSDALRAQGKSM